MSTEERKTVVVTDNENIDFNANGSAVLVQLQSDGYNGVVDFQTTVDGVTFYNIPYVSRVKPGALPTTAQITPSGIPSPTLYFLQGPLSQVRIACSGLSSGSLTVVYRTIPGATLDRQELPYDYIISSREVMPTIDNEVSGLRLLQYDTGEVFRAIRGRWLSVDEGSLKAIEEILLRMEVTDGEILTVLREFQKDTD